MSDNVNIIVQDTINEIVVNSAVTVETIDINVQVAVDEVNIIANPNNYVVNINRIIGEQVQSDWDQNDDQAPDYIKNKPSIPTLTSDLTNDGEDGVNPFITANDVTPQVNSDWNATSGVAEILNKPTSLPPNGAASGDLQGNYPNPTVHRVHGVDFQSGAPAVDDTWVYVSTPFGQQPFQWQHSKLKTSQVQNDSTVTGTNADDALEHLDSSKVATTRSISTTTPLQGGGDLSANRTLSILQSNTTQSGFLSNTDWNTFNGKFTLPSLTSGSVLFSNGTTIAQDNAQLFWDDTNNRLGIGTTAPSQKLEVVGNVIVNSLAPFIDLYSTQTGTPSWKIYNSYNVTGDFSIVGGTSVSNKFRIQPNGNVGIGSLTPTEILEVSSTGTTGLAITRNALANASRLFFKTTGTYNWSIGLRGSRNDLSIFNETSIEALTINSTTNNVLINNTTDRGGVLQVKAPGALSTDIAFKIRNSADNADLFNINGLGNVGIGIATPLSSAKLDITSTTQGFLPPRMTTAQRNAIVTPATGLIVYDTTYLTEFQYNGTSWISNQPELNGTGFVKASGTTISYDNSVYAPIIAKQILLSSITGTTTNTIISSYLLSANLFSQNDFLDILCSVYKPSTSNNATIRVYLNSSVSLTGATLVGTYALTSTTKFVNFQRTHVFLSTGTNGQFWGFPPTVSSITDRAITNIEMVSMIYNNENNGYIIFALQLSNSADQVGINAIKVTK